jgi:protein farnesyltransferase subunit beta
MATGSSVSFWRSQFDQLILQDDGICTDTITEQYKVEKSVMKIFKNLRDSKQAEQIYLFKERHLAYLNNGIRNLSCHFDCLDASRPWLCYWILQSMALLKYTISNEVATDIIEFLKKCKSPSGGYGGGPGQLPHLAPTYAAVLSLCLIGTKEAYDSIDRDLLQNFLTSLHQSDGSFIMHRDGEVDIRGVYCALVPAILTCILTEEMIENTAQWIVSCQSYEGGFSAVPGTEAHGGYTFCGFASLFLLKQPNLCDIQKLLRWACNRQMPLEGGFQGRTNKLVDGCYSFWVGGLFPLLYMALKQSGEEDSLLHPYLWHCHQGQAHYDIQCVFYH